MSAHLSRQRDCAAMDMHQAVGKVMAVVLPES
jgi:hypothetical protein